MSDKVRYIITMEDVRNLAFSVFPRMKQNHTTVEVCYIKSKQISQITENRYNGKKKGKRNNENHQEDNYRNGN